MAYVGIKDELFGMPTVGKAVTATLFVSPNGDGTDTELIAAAAIDKPFKVLAYSLQPSSDENTLIRFSANSGITWFAEDMFATKKNKATGNGDATDFIFNAGTRISASVYSPGAGRTVKVWLEIQEI